MSETQEETKAVIGKRPAPTPKPRAKSMYHLYAEDEENVLHPLGEHEGATPEDAINTWSDAHPDEDIVGVVFVPIASRNFARVTGEIEKRVKLTRVQASE